jgi:subtilisin family serine protease
VSFDKISSLIHTGYLANPQHKDHSVLNITIRANVFFLVVIALLFFTDNSNFVNAKESDSGARGQTISWDSLPYVPEDVLVQFKVDEPLSTIQTTIASLGGAETDQIKQISLRKIRVPRGQEQEIVKDLLRLPNIESAELNYIISGHSRPLNPNDPYYAESQWNMTRILANYAWGITTGTESIRVAVIDSGIDLSHPDLGANIVSGYNVIDPTLSPNDDHGHGTHVAGLIAAIGNNNLGIAGSAWNVKLVPVKALDSTNRGTLFNLAKAIVWAADSNGGNAKILNNSWGSIYSSFGLIDAVRYAQDQGALLVASAGNCADPNSFLLNGCTVVNQPSYPAALDGVMAVAATGYDGTYDVHPKYSNYGSYISVSAPGGIGALTYHNSQDWILSTFARDVSCPLFKCPSSGYAYDVGTSMAAPHVSGLAALIWTINSNLSAQNVRSIIEQNSDDQVGNPNHDTLGWDEYYGWGRINFYSAVNAVPLVPPSLITPFDNSLVSLRPTLDWSDTQTADKYIVHLSRFSDFSIIEAINVIPESTFTPGNNLAINQRYYWRVYAGREYKTSESSQVWSFVTHDSLIPTSPANPIPADNLTLERTSNTILSWTTNATMCSIHIQGGSININPSNNCASLLLGNQRGGSYSWQVTASNVVGTTQGPIWHFNIKPYEPTNLSSSAASATQIRLNWTLSSDEPSDVDGYEVLYSNGTVIANVPKGTSSYAVDGLTCSQQYSFAVKAVRQSVSSNPSNTATATTYACSGSSPSAPSNLQSISVTQSAVTLIWQDNANNEDGFKIERSPDGNNGWAQIITVSANAQTFTDSGLSSGTTYYYRVRAYNAGGDSTYTNVVNATTSGPTPNLATLNGHITLQGRPAAPNNRWVIPLTLKFNGTQHYTFTTTTDTYGNFTVAGLEPGSYEVWIKGEHTLQNKSVITLVGGDNPRVDLGLLREGDANNDNVVSAQDFDVLKSSFNRCQSNSGYDVRADFNNDACVTLLDFSLLSTNYDQTGVAPFLNWNTSLPGNGPRLFATPSVFSVESGQTFIVTVRVETGSSRINAAQALLKFDPTLIEVRSVNLSSALPITLKNAFDNQAGVVKFGVGTFDLAPSGTISLAQIEFQARTGKTGTTSLAFTTGAPWASDLTFGGASVLGQVDESTILVGLGHRLYLPIIQR